MEDKFLEYYSLVDIYKKEENNPLLYKEEHISSKSQLFEMFTPLLMINQKIIINKL